MFPYRDDTPSFSPPTWVLILIILNVIFFAMSWSGGLDGFINTIFTYGTIPARFHQGAGDVIDYDSELTELIGETEIETFDSVAPFLTLITAVFLHGGIFHLIGNMWFLWLFGDNVEDRLGKLIFPIFYIICGIVAGLIHIMAEYNSVVPAIGASGAIAGVMGAYIYMFPRGSIATLWGYYFYWTTIHIPAPIFLGIWFIFQLFGGLASGGSCNVAFWAHIGGFLAGLFLAMILQLLRRINWYPGDRGYTAYVPIRSARTQVTATPRRKRRYTWRDY